jgi:hypothetical protein
MALWRRMLGEFKLIGMVTFVVGTVWIYGWSEQVSAQADAVFTCTKFEPKTQPPVLHATIVDLMDEIE